MLYRRTGRQPGWLATPSCAQPTRVRFLGTNSWCLMGDLIPGCLLGCVCMRVCGGVCSPGRKGVGCHSTGRGSQ
uniref:Uncharacterized protein n=1 Tax=Arundo donax TaxID=35708 RepID=A0A0A9H2N4_ARUDO